MATPEKMLELLKKKGKPLSEFHKGTTIHVSNKMVKGYSYTLHKGKIITSTEEINVGDEITTQLFQGEITSILKDKKENG